MTKPGTTHAVLDEIIIGAPIIRPDRFLVPCTIRKGESRVEMAYRCNYAEPVFAADGNGSPDIASQNLASMAAVMPVLNFAGLAGRIVLEGVYDSVDRDFLETCAWIASREVWARQLAEPNALMQDWVLQAAREEGPGVPRLEFVGRDLPDIQFGNSGAAFQDESYGVLSSGGKESLLSFGILKRLNKTAHPVYINLAGRQWRTALKSYRQMRAADALTSRVWTNVDRFYAWFHRNLPIVKKDFSRITSEQYAIPMWVLPPYIFGTLPLLRKRGLQNLVIGNEYDCSKQKITLGVEHYGGLYDQSIWCDQDFSAYYSRKGWKLNQFSMVRCLSEVLIERMLINHFPQLAATQISCPKAIAADGTSRPCGSCEKCVRILTFALALDADPLAFGFTPASIDSALKHFWALGTDSELECQEHVAWLLATKGMEASHSDARVKPVAHPEMFKLRVHSLISPYEAVPAALRESLFQFLTLVSDGVVEEQVEPSPAPSHILVKPSGKVDVAIPTE